MLVTHKLTLERKNDLKNRLSGAFYLILLCVAYVICVILCDPRHKIDKDANSFDGFAYYIPIWGNLIFAIIMIFFKIALVFAICLELDNCFIKSNHNKKIIATLFLCLLIPILAADYCIIYYSYFGVKQDYLQITPIIYFCLFFVNFIFIIPICFLSKNSKNFNKFNGICLPTISFILIVALNAISYLCVIRGIFTLLIILLIPVCSDVGGYIFGIFFGQHKLAPKISPKKTWEGFAGSLIFSIIFIVLLIFLYGYGSHYQMQGNLFGNQWDQNATKNSMINPNKLLWWIIIVIMILALTVTSIVSDLLFSVFKRKNGIKDYSNIIKGHGGVLDRIDSWVLPLCLFFIIVLSISGSSTIISGWKDHNRIFNIFYEG